MTTTVQSGADDEGAPSEFIQRDIVIESAPALPPGRDHRLYVPKPAGWEAAIKQTWEQEYCYSKNPGEDWFHLLANGELYIQRGTEKFCLSCALRLKILTRNRLFWQKGSRGPADDE
ncbi:MAG: hypothetical protein JWN70_154 [Planctomycetaceae bacterium]|nr:hypothetical protein [Planctomycetaceae bacterium]